MKGKTEQPIVYVIADSWAIFDNSSDTPALIAFHESGTLTIHDAEKYTIVTGKRGTI